VGTVGLVLTLPSISDKEFLMAPLSSRCDRSSPAKGTAALAGNPFPTADPVAAQCTCPNVDWVVLPYVPEAAYVDAFLSKHANNAFTFDWKSKQPGRKGDNKH